VAEVARGERVGHGCFTQLFVQHGRRQTRARLPLTPRLEPNGGVSLKGLHAGRFLLPKDTSNWIKIGDLEINLIPQYYGRIKSYR